MFISETHFTKGQKFDIPGYKSFHNSFSSISDKKSRWGISCFISNSYIQYVLDVNCHNNNHILVTFKGQHRLFGSYIPPSDSIYYSEEYFYNFSHFMSPVDSDCTFIGGGDLNCRVNNNTKAPTSMSYRKNPDNGINSNGRLLLKLCNSFNFFIINNLNYKNKIFDGKFTFNKADRKSQNDLCISNLAGLESIQSFDIHEVPFNFSDHLPLSLSIILNFNTESISKKVSADILTHSFDRPTQRPKKINPKNINWDAFQTTTSINLSEISQRMINSNSFSQNDIDTLFSDLEMTIYNTAVNCQLPPKRNIPSPQIYIPETRNIDEIMHNIVSSEHHKWREILQNNDIKGLWNLISWKESSSLEHPVPSAKDLGKQFALKSSIENEEIFKFENNRHHVSILDDPITLAEIEAASDKLKENKSTSDGWTPRMITSISNTLFPILQLLLNIIFYCALYPTHWRTTIVSAIFKNKGKYLDPKNYRPISLVQMLSKLFDFILLNRFKKWFTPNDSQSAYQSKRCCAEHVFLIRALINHCKSSKNKLFVICIDFEGAFDKISRQRLFRKLQLFGAGTTFIISIMTIYLFTDYVIFQSETHFCYHLIAGIKQGLPLSPLLFIFYINDIFDLFNGVYGHNHILETLHILIHADDTTILASSRSSAERKIKTLLSYCRSNYINLQLSKCEFIVINGSVLDKQDIDLTSGRIRNVSHVTLLGSQIGQSGKIKDDLNLTMGNRFYSVSKFYNFIRSNKLAPISVKLKVMQACVLSSLLHNCEAFGDNIPQDMEKVYFEMIKTCLNVRKNTPNKIILIESGMKPLKSIIMARQLNFIRKFVENLADSSPRKTVFEYLRNNGNPYVCYYVNLDNSFSSKHVIYSSKMLELKNDINMLAQNDNYKFMMYKKFNPHLSTPDLNQPYSQGFIRLRTSSHSLPIELGRWSRTERVNRLCNECNCIGDEVHYIYHCTTIDRTGWDPIPPLSELSSYRHLASLISNFKFNFYL